MEALQLTKIERFSLKKYQQYQKQGLPVRLVTGRGTEVHIVAQNVGVDKKQFIVETEVLHSDWRTYPYVEWWVINPSGKPDRNDYKMNVYIQTGAIDVKPGDIILYGSRADEFFYFMAMFDHISCLDGKGMPGFCLQWTMDLHGHQFCQAGTFHDLDRSINDRDFYMRKATEAEIDQYWKFIEDNGLRYDENQKRLMCFPKVGQPYWTIELVNGEPQVVAHEAPKTEDERPIHNMCFTREDTANTYKANMNHKIFG